MFAAVDDGQDDHQGIVIEASGMLHGIPISILFDSDASDSFISSSIVERCGLTSAKQADRWQVELATCVYVFVGAFIPSCKLDLGTIVTSVDL